MCTVYGYAVNSMCDVLYYTESVSTVYYCTRIFLHAVAHTLYSVRYAYTAAHTVCNTLYCVYTANAYITDS